MILGNEFYLQCLREEYARRNERNPAYSLRAFSRNLLLDVGALSRILAGKQVPSFRITQQLLTQLDLDPTKKKQFLSSVKNVQARRSLKRENGFARVAQATKLVDLNIEYFRVMSDWYHFAILELTFVKGFRSNVKWIAGQLGISQMEAKFAIERLLELGLLEVKKKRWVKASPNLSTYAKSTETSAALRRNQKQMLEKAIDSLENAPLVERNTTGMTMAIDPELLPIAKKMIHEFNQKLCEVLESGKRKRVYNLSIALFPVQKKAKK